MRRSRSRPVRGRGPRRLRAGRGARPLRAVLAGILAAIVVLLAGIWLGGHPNHLPSLLRGSVFERGGNDMVTEQALDILTQRYFRPLDRSSLVDLGLSGMVAGFDDTYSRYIDPSSYQAPLHESDEHTQSTADFSSALLTGPESATVTGLQSESTVEESSSDDHCH
jgi:hypothetical protein